MSDVMDILTGLKGKVIDLATLEMLKKNYELLEENNTQLSHNAQLANGRADRLGTENDQLKDETRQLRDELAKYQAPKGLSDLAMRVVRCYRDGDCSEMLDTELIRMLGCKAYEFEATAIELRNANYLRATSIRGMSIREVRFNSRHESGGTTYSLTSEGKAFLLKC